MAESVYPAPFQATSRDGQTELQGEPFGPAGTSSLELSDGTVWEVDHAEPTQLVSLLLEGDLERSTLARDLLGAERFDWTCAQLDAQRAAKKPGKRLQAGVPGDPSDVWGTSSPRFRGSNDLAALVGTAVLMADMSTDESLSPLVRLAAGLEFVVRVRDGYLGSLFEGAVGPMVDQLYDIALQVGPDDFEELGRQAEKPLHRFESIVRWVRQEVPSLELPLRQVSELMSRRVGGGGGLVGNAGGFVGDGVASSMRMRTTLLAMPDAMSDVDSFGAPPPEDFIEIDMPEAGQVVVRVSRQHEGKWVRIVKTAGLVPLALVPLVEDGMLLEALAVVPSDLEVPDLVVEVVEPDQAVRPERPLRLVGAAVEAGRAAARYERLGRPDDASDAWRECSRLWSDAGDPGRASLAEARAHGSRQWNQRGLLGAFVADELLAVAMGVRTGRN